MPGLVSIYWIWLIPPLVLLAAMILQVQTFRQYDRILFAIYTRSKEDWVKLDRPHGFLWRYWLFWRPPEASVLSMSSSMSRANLFTILSSGQPTVFDIEAWNDIQDDLLERKQIIGTSRTPLWPSSPASCCVE